jgi:hypothetical protein
MTLTPSRSLLSRFAFAAAILVACALVRIPTTAASPTPESLREGRDPVTGRRVVRPRTIPPLWRSFSAATSSGAAATLQDGAPGVLDFSYPERVLDEIAAHNERDPDAITVLPTSQSYDRGNIAVIEDDGTILVPDGANVAIDATAVTRRFIELHHDEYDYIAVFSASNMTNLTLGGGFAYELNVVNNVDGLGLSQFDFASDFGSDGTLQSYLNMNRLSVYPANPFQDVVATNNGLDVIAHESAHRFIAYTYFDSSGVESPALLGRDNQHWGFFFNTLASEMEGNRWRDNGDGTFTTIDATSQYSFLDEYLYGLRDSSAVDTLWYVRNPGSFNPPNVYVRQSHPEIGVTATGTKQFVDISQITSVNGLRSPGVATSPKTFRMAWVLLVRNGDVPTSADLAKIELYRSNFVPYFASAIHGLAAIDSHLNSVPGTVAIAHVPLKDTENTVSPRTVTADMTIAQKSLLIGFDSASARLHYRTNGGAFNTLVMSPQGGDTYAAAIPTQSAGTTVDYYFTGSSDSAGIDGTLPATAPAAFFRYHVGPDVTPPVLTHTPPPDPAASQMPITVRVAAFDNLGLDSVIVEWKKTGGPLQRVATPATGDGDYTFAIGAGAVFGDVITYRFTAVDQALGKNRAQLPAVPQPFALLVGNNYAETFEGADGGYTHAAVSPPRYTDEWHPTTERNHTPGGAHAWKCGSDGPGTYRSSLDAGLVSVPIAVGPGGHLKFWHFYDAETGDTPAEAYDGGAVQLSTDGGASFSYITPIGGYPATVLPNPSNPMDAFVGVYSGQSGGFVQADFDLSAWAGQTVRFRWRFASDGFVTKEGWYVDDVTVTSTGGTPVSVPVAPGAGFSLAQAVPNPSVERAAIAFHLPSAQHVRLALYDVKGRLVRTLVDGAVPAGDNSALWDGRRDDGRSVPAGLYFYRLTAARSGALEGRLIRLP